MVHIINISDIWKSYVHHLFNSSFGRYILTDMLEFVLYPYMQIKTFALDERVALVISAVHSNVLLYTKKMHYVWLEHNAILINLYINRKTA